MSTPTEIEARRTVVALVRAEINGDRAAGAALVAGESAEDAVELMRALEGWALALAPASGDVGSPDNPPAFDHSSPAADAATFDALLDYTCATSRWPPRPPARPRRPCSTGWRWRRSR